MQNIPHIPVLYREVIDAFSPCEEGIIIDCTLGYAGHSSMLLEAYPDIKLIGIDQDQMAIDFSTERLAPFGERAEIRKGRFSKIIGEILNDVNSEKICGVLADIGVSSLQLDQKDRGFSYESETLDMRMDKNVPLSAQEVVNSYSRDQLEYILREYGELSNAKKVAAHIVEHRPFYSAKALSDSIRPLMYGGKKIHPSTLVMQAIRIEVNDELGELKGLLDAIAESDIPRARVAIISFHSLEDRIVKQKFVAWQKQCICDEHVMRCECGNNHAKGKIVSKKPIMAQEDELKENPRSRSAKLRVFQLKR